MSKRQEKPHFSDRLLDVSERVQAGFGHTALVRAFTSSTSEAYRQLEWRSQKIQAFTDGSVHVAGDPSASRLARNWKNAVVLSADRTKLVEAKAENANVEEAVAYISDKKVHVGIGSRAVEGALFGDLDDANAGVAMRLGSASVDIVMGLWVPTERTFVGLETQVAQESVAIDDISAAYPNIYIV